ncbi:hypothetical protein FGG08_001616 [Glutinoglossum americanum]|uniref:Major facilitator superfamily (MFS) profile domain-containing protein n=1 Tax=Glutinoglossum americanum TaxID=1670608 RepID=A0A9P8L2J1_9PEZI|nr:hypothetical protein FGG08_001616 [Glutinoglossum americanum]
MVMIAFFLHLHTPRTPLVDGLKAIDWLAVLGEGPLISGILLLPYALTLSIGSGVVGIFIRKTGRYLEAIWFGMVVMTLGMGLLIDLPLVPSWPRIILYQVVAGIGAGPNFQAPLIALQSMISPRDIATATSTFGFTRNIGTSIAVVIGGVVFQNGMQDQVAGLRASLGDRTAALLSGGTAGANVRIVNSLPHAKKAIAREAFRLALRKMWILFVGVSAFGMVASLFVGEFHTGRTSTTWKIVPVTLSHDYKRALLTDFPMSGKQTLSKENLQVKTGLPQRDEYNKDGDQGIVPAVVGDSRGDVIDKV